MKLHHLVLTTLLATAAGTVELSAQQLVPYLGGGLAIGTGDLGTDSSSGWVVIGGFDVPVPAIAREFAVGVTGSFARIPYQGGFSEASQVTMVAGELVYTIGSPGSLLRPFVRGGGGIQVQRYDPGSITASPTTDAVASFTGAAGLNILAGPGDVVLGARFTSGLDAGSIGIYGAYAVPIGAPRF